MDSKVLTYTRLYSDSSGESRFEDIKIGLADRGAIGYLSAGFNAKDIQFRLNKPDYDYDFHNAPARQFIILLDGEIEITTSLGEIRRFRGGDILLVEDTSGKGHRSRNISQQPRRSVFIPISDDNT